MKHSLLLIAIFIASCSNNQKSIKEKKVNITPNIIDFGIVNKGDSVDYKVTLKNISPSDTIFIKGVSSSCSCIILDNNKADFVLPNDSIQYNAMYDSNKGEKGDIDQTISFHTNADNSFSFIKIKGFVK